MAITIANLRIAPYTQKDTLKVVFGDTMELTFAIPHVDGESFMCGLDNERVVYPPSRPICAYTNAFTRDGENVTFKLKLTTSKLRDYVSTLRKPMPIWLQIVRAVNGKYETVLLDDILALPSVIDGAMTVCEGDPLAELLEAKMDKPATEGSNGQVLTMNADGHYVWADLPEIPEQQQANWEELDSTDVTYIKNKPQLAKVATSGNYNDLNGKPQLATVATSGSYNDLIDKPTIPEQVQANYDESDSTDASYIRNKPVISQVGHTGEYADLLNKPTLATVATSGNYNDLTNKPTIPELVQSDWDESDSGDDAFIKNKPTIPTVNDATVTINQGGVEKGTFTLNQSGNTTINLNDGAQSDWDESDSTDVSYIRNKPTIPQPIPQVQSDWDESDSTDVSYIQNKPTIPEQANANWDESDSTNPSYIENKPDIGQMIADALTFHNN